MPSPTWNSLGSSAKQSSTLEKESVFVVVPNLLASLEALDEREPWAIGRALPGNLLKQGMPGPGALFSRPTLERLLGQLDRCLHRRPSKPADAFLLRCAALDPAIEPARLAGQYVGKAADVMDGLRPYHPEGLVQFPLAFMDAEPADMYTYDYFFFHAKTHGPTRRPDYRWSTCGATTVDSVE